MDLGSVKQAGRVFLALFPWILALAGLHQWAYNKFPKYYFTIMKFFKKWRDTKWSINTIYAINRDIDFFKVFEKNIKNQFGNFSRSVNLKNKKFYEFGDFSVFVQFDLDISQTENVQVELLFNKLNVTYYTAQERLKELRILFNNLEKEINIKSKNYNMDINFTTISNPFYGLMIQRLGEEHVKEFECVFPVSVFINKEIKQKMKDNLDLRVFKEKITINEQMFDNVEEIAKQCLLLGG